MSADGGSEAGTSPDWRQSVLVSHRINPGMLLAALLLILGAQNLLLWRYLNFAPIWSYPLAIVCFIGLALFMVKAAFASQWRGPSAATLLLLFGASILIFMLGGEGRVFYANADWQVRDAVLHDLSVNPWPFVYRQNRTLELLRAPIGMFVIPALVGKTFGPLAADWSMLVQNSLLLTLLLGLGSTLLQNARQRIITFAVMVLFSGMDIIGQLLRSAATGEEIPDHIERWANGTQFSSHLTQAFWVPQHALAGWFGALMFLLWRAGSISLGQMYLFLPMLMLLSPLGVMGALPFAAYAGFATLLKASLRPSDFILPALTTLLCIPAILYLGAAGDNVGIHLLRLSPDTYLLFELLEVLVFPAGVVMFHRGDLRDTALLVLVTLCLLAMPFVQIGEGGDFTMRVSIVSLALLAFLVAQVITGPRKNISSEHRARALLLVALAIGSVTGMFEVVRAIRYRPSPYVHCSVTSAGHQLVDLQPTSTNATYFAPLAAISPMVRPVAANILRPEGDPRCWDRPWKVSRFAAHSSRRVSQGVSQ